MRSDDVRFAQFGSTDGRSDELSTRKSWFRGVSKKPGICDIATLGSGDGLGRGFIEDWGSLIRVGRSREPPHSSLLEEVELLRTRTGEFGVLPSGLSNVNTEERDQRLYRTDVPDDPPRT